MKGYDFKLVDQSAIEAALVEAEERGEILEGVVVAEAEKPERGVDGTVRFTVELEMGCVFPDDLMAVLVPEEPG